MSLRFTDCIVINIYIYTFATLVLQKVYAECNHAHWISIYKIGFKKPFVSSVMLSENVASNSSFSTWFECKIPFILKEVIWQNKEENLIAIEIHLTSILPSVDRLWLTHKNVCFAYQNLYSVKSSLNHCHDSIELNIKWVKRAHKLPCHSLDDIYLFIFLFSKNAVLCFDSCEHFFVFIFARFCDLSTHIEMHGIHLRFNQILLSVYHALICKVVSSWRLFFFLPFNFYVFRHKKNVI